MIELDDVIVLSLPVDRARRDHIDRHFREIGMQGFRFFDAIPQSDPRVRAAYRDGRVAAFPPCFRCGRIGCAHHNNILIPPQVANCLSFRDIWASLPDDPDRFFLLCEDDVAFHTGALELLRGFLRGFVRHREQVLVRLSDSGLEPFRDLSGSRLQTTDEPIMSNSAYILNGALAARLARDSQRVTTTSDVWLHRDMAQDPDIQAVTLEPLLATDLSFNRDHARFVSRIHPKGIDPADRARMAQHVMRVETEADYEALLRAWSES